MGNNVEMIKQRSTARDYIVFLAQLKFFSQV